MTVHELMTDLEGLLSSNRITLNTEVIVHVGVTRGVALHQLNQQQAIHLRTDSSASGTIVTFFDEVHAVAIGELEVSDENEESDRWALVIAGGPQTETLREQYWEAPC